MSVQKSILLSYDKYVRWQQIVKEHKECKHNDITCVKEPTNLENKTESVPDTEHISEGSTLDESQLTPSEHGAMVANDIVQESPPSGDDKLDTSIILSCIAKNLKSKASALLSYISSDKSPLSWNRIGELCVNGSAISHTHIADLIRDTLKCYANFNPRGAEAYYRGLSRSNIPANLVGNARRLAEIDSYKRELLIPEEPCAHVQVGSGSHTPKHVSSDKPTIIVQASIEKIKKFMKPVKVSSKVEKRRGGQTKHKTKRTGWIKIS